MDTGALAALEDDAGRVLEKLYWQQRWDADRSLKETTLKNDEVSAA